MGSSLDRREHPEYYTHDPVTDTIVHPANTDWYDVADLNYDQPGLTEAMIGEMAYWVKEVGIDGFRCDMAGMVPVSFWEEATPALLSLKSDLFLLAETMDPPLRNEQLFHADYGWAFKDLANGICQGQKAIADLNTYLNEDQQPTDRVPISILRPIMMRTAGTGPNLNVWEKERKPCTFSRQHCRGIPLIYSGQEEPLQKRLLFFEKDDIEFKTFGYAGFYQRLNQLKQVNSAVYSPPYGGVLTILAPSNLSTFAYTRENGDDKLLVVVNLSDQAQETRIDIGDWNGTYRDIFRGTQQALANPMTLQIGPWGYMVLSNR
ncbi:MAG: alpha-glucosidase C-terminal domain-containing protein [Saprospiraceae bacterium]